MEKFEKEVVSWLKKNRSRFKEIAYMAGVTERTLDNITKKPNGKRHKTVVAAINAIYEGEAK